MIKKDGEFYALFIQYNSTGLWEKLEEEYISNKQVYEHTYYELYEQNANKTFLEDNGQKYLHINENEIFCAGDNRFNSNDCFDYGAKNVENITGEVVYLVHGNGIKIFQIIIQVLGFKEWK